MSRIAIVIGVNKPRAPAPLKGAVSDAAAFAVWIEKQGFETTSFVDDHKPVTLASIFAEVERVVNLGTYSQMVIYFAGHGLQNGGSEVWLLSGAPDNPGEAISVEASVMAARESGLTSVVFISDACRSIPNNLQSSRLDGNSIFPNRQLNRRTRPEVDRLFATLPSLVAVEAAKADDNARREGVFTREFMLSYRDPPATLIEQRMEAGQSFEIVTNRKLKDLVRTLVEGAAFAAAPQSAQLPEFILESVDAYVGRVERAQSQTGQMPRLPLPDIGTSLGKEIKELRGRIEGFDFSRKDREAAAPQSPRRVPPPSVGALAKRAIDVAQNAGSIEETAAAAAGIDRSLGFEASINLFSLTPLIDHFETQTGFSVTGANVKSANCPHLPVDVPDAQFVRLWPDNNGEAPSASVLVEFDNGNGTVLPGLRGYIGHIFVEQGVVVNVNYVPAANSSLWPSYEAQREEVEALRAAVAAAARLGVFRIAPSEAASFGDKLRRLKIFDPTLCLYTTYAYASAGLEDKLRSVLPSICDSLRTMLFDCAMLADRNVIPHETGPQTVLPFCPMLRHGWALLAVREAQLADAARKARDFLLPALWTTFAAEGVTMLGQAIARADFK
jgi:Caspase domain